MKQAFRSMVIDEAMFEQLGPAINSARSMFLFGPPGNGKTAIAETLVRMQGGAVYVPHAVAIGSEVVRVYDPVHHQSLSDQETVTAEDPRWILTKRPVVTVGGELTLPMLDLIYSEHGKFYEAPFQFKANNGAFFIDDFGRQQVSPHDLLNRWIVPLEKRVDYLTLRTGQKIEVPFGTLVMFSTNLEPRDLVDEAFLRRIRYKIEIKSPTPDQFKEIFKRVCAAKNFTYDDAVVDYLLTVKYPELAVTPRAVHPRDLLEQVVDYCSYRETPPRLTNELMDIACHNYFVHL
jgi:predicted ATPase with chaperone activity